MKYSLVISTTDASFDALAFKGDLIKGVEMAKEVGYDAVEIAIRDPKNVDVKILMDLLEKKDMKVSAIGTGQAFLTDKLSLSSLDEEVRKKAVERLKEHIDFARYVGGYVIIGLIRGFFGKERKKAYEKLVESVKEVCSYAEKKDVKLVVEPINRYECDNMNTVEETLEFLNTVNCQYLGLLLDTFHMNIEEPIIEKSIRKTKGKLYHFHVADSNRWAPGCGHIDFKSIMKALREIGYEGFISVECLPIPGGPKESAKIALKTLKECEGD